MGKHWNNSEWTYKTQKKKRTETVADCADEAETQWQPGKGIG